MNTLKNYARAQSHSLPQKTPWASLNHTLHIALQHSSELMEINGNTGLGGYSEEGLEAKSKDVRRLW